MKEKNASINYLKYKQTGPPTPPADPLTKNQLRETDTQENLALNTPTANPREKEIRKIGTLDSVLTDFVLVRKKGKTVLTLIPIVLPELSVTELDAKNNNPKEDSVSTTSTALTTYNV